MQVMDAHGAGVDVHQKTVVAYVLTPPGHETRPCGTMTAALLTLADWLLVCGGTPVALESTGDDGQPVLTILEGTGEVVWGTAQHIKAVPGRQTAVTAAAWLAALVPHGVWRASVIPPVAQRERRDLSRYRRTAIPKRVTLINRVHKLLEEANSTLAAVASESLGGAGRAILAALLTGPPAPQALADWAKGRLRRTRDQLGMRWTAGSNRLIA